MLSLDYSDLILPFKPPYSKPRYKNSKHDPGSEADKASIIKFDDKLEIIFYVYVYGYADGISTY